jgi:hypothetical protein
MTKSGDSWVRMAEMAVGNHYAVVTVYDLAGAVTLNSVLYF